MRSRWEASDSTSSVVRCGVKETMPGGQLVDGQEADQRGHARTPPASTACSDLPPHRLPDRDHGEQDRDQQQQRDDRRPAAQLEGVGEPEQARTGGQATRPPVAEDQRGQADEAAAAGLALAVDVGDEDQEDAAQPGQRRRR